MTTSRTTVSSQLANDYRLRVYDSVLGLLSSIDNPTPLVRLIRVVAFEHTSVFAKLEWYNPFGSVKDRVASNMVRDAEEHNTVGADQKLVEPTSGNTGIALAMIANAKGYSLTTPLSNQVPVEKRTLLRFAGADVIELEDDLCPAPWAPDGAIAKADEIALQSDFRIVNQYMNEANPDAHYRTTGPEIWKQTKGGVTHVVAALGTCGTITGAGRFLKEQNDHVEVLGVYPATGHEIPGVRSIDRLRQTRFFSPDEYDGMVEIENNEAFELRLRLNQLESLTAGPSSGLALAGALKQVPDEPGTVVVVAFADSIFKLRLVGHEERERNECSRHGWRKETTATARGDDRKRSWQRESDHRRQVCARVVGERRSNGRRRPGARCSQTRACTRRRERPVARAARLRVPPAPGQGLDALQHL